MKKGADGGEGWAVEGGVEGVSERGRVRAKGAESVGIGESNGRWRGRGGDGKGERSWARSLRREREGW